MDWTEVVELGERYRFVGLATQPGVNVTELCRRFGFSRKKGYRLLRRYRQEGRDGLVSRSRRPHRSPARTSEAVERLVLAVRDKHPAWGGLKIRARLAHLGHPEDTLPSARTMQAILLRHGRISPEETAKHKAWQRFEHDAPNRLWQMDYKGHFPTRTVRCHPLTILDDHSRFSLGLFACKDQQGATVRGRLSGIFGLYGLPECLLVDNGSPWGCDADNPYTPLTVWLLRLGTEVWHARAYHPQTLGKAERFHRTLKAEVLRDRDFRDLEECQEVFDRWQEVYNFERPHQALGLAVPASRYRPSPRRFPQPLPPIEYGPDDVVRKVQDKGRISYRNRVYRVPKAFKGYPVALRPTLTDGVLDVFFCAHKVAQIDLRAHDGASA